MYRIMYCKTLNPLGETGAEDFDRLDQTILFLRSLRNNGIERMSAGFTVYVVDKDGGLGDALLNWQQDGENIFGRLEDPDRPELFFSA